MTMRVEAAFDLAEISGGFSIANVVETGGNTFAVSMTTGRHFLSYTGATATGDHAPEVAPYTSFLAALDALMEAGGDPAGSYTWSLTAAGRVRMVHDGGGSVTAVALNLNAFAKELLGFTVNPSGGLDYTGDRDPKFCLNTDVGFWTERHEAEGGGDIAKDAIGHDGTPGGIAKEGGEDHDDYVVPLEQRGRVYTRHVASCSPAALWTWQHFFAHVRNVRPFVMATDEPEVVYELLRAEGAKFSPQPIAGNRNYTGHYDIPIRARVLARG